MSYKTSVVVTTHGKAFDLPIMLRCLEVQRIYGEGQHSRDKSPIFYAAKGYAPYPYEVVITVDGDLKSFSDEATLRSADGNGIIKILENPKEGKVGHNTRGPGIEAATGDYIVLTNSDNYFMQGWLHAVNQRYGEDIGVIYWNCINNLWRWGDLGGCQLKRGHIDLACAAVKAEIAKEVGFPFRDYEGDWDYINACVKLSRSQRLRTVHINETLSVHN